MQWTYILQTGTWLLHFLYQISIQTRIWDVKFRLNLMPFRNCRKSITLPQKYSSWRRRKWRMEEISDFSIWKSLLIFHFFIRNLYFLKKIDKFTWHVGACLQIIFRISLPANLGSSVAGSIVFRRRMECQLGEDIINQVTNVFFVLNVLDFKMKVSNTGLFSWFLFSYSRHQKKALNISFNMCKYHWCTPKSSY